MPCTYACAFMRTETNHCLTNACRLIKVNLRNTETIVHIEHIARYLGVGDDVAMDANSKQNAEFLSLSSKKKHRQGRFFESLKAFSTNRMALVWRIGIFVPPDRQATTTTDRHNRSLYPLQMCAE